MSDTLESFRSLLRHSSRVVQGSQCFQLDRSISFRLKVGLGFRYLQKNDRISKFSCWLNHIENPLQSHQQTFPAPSHYTTSLVALKSGLGIFSFPRDREGSGSCERKEHSSQSAGPSVSPAEVKYACSVISQHLEILLKALCQHAESA